MDWASITAKVEKARTLNTQELSKFLDGLSDDEESNAITHLLERTCAPTDFLATSSPDPFADDAILPNGTTVGIWKIKGVIGRGGMGDVYKAERADGLYEKTVALKLIKGVSAETRSQLFEIERQRLALMDHPGIARIIDGGTTDDGRPFMAMDYVDGVPIIEHVKTHELRRSQRLALFRNVCDSVEHAHAKLVLHRDIKSENVLVAKDDMPRLIDFGIASDLESGAGIKGALSMASAAPEQLKDESVSVQTDVFALGVLLHELLTDKKPKRLANGGMQADKSKINDLDLFAILSKALALEPSHRYVSATKLSEDILAFLERRPVTASNGGWRYSLVKFIKRYPMANGLAIVAILSLSGGLAASLKFANEAKLQAQRVERELYRANWQFSRTEAINAAQQAYSDVLQRTFGGEEDVKRLSELLIARWEEAFAAYEDSPKTAAALSYAVGRNFYFRGDTATALKVFDLWMEKRFGEPALVALGEEVYALMLSDAGRLEESTAILRRLVEFYGDGSLTSDADASNYANRLARATRAPEDIERSVRLLEKRLSTLKDPFERLFGFSQLAGMRMLQGDFETATYAYGKTVEIFEQNPGFASYGRDIARFNLAGITFSWKRDIDKVDELVTAILTQDVELKGESIQQARALMLSAMLHSERSDHDMAMKGIEQANTLFARYAGENSNLHLLSKGIQACLYAQADDAENAKLLMADLQSILGQSEQNERTVNGLRLLGAYVKLLANKLTQDDIEWLETENAHKEAGSNMILLHFYRSLVDKGHAPEFWMANNQS